MNLQVEELEREEDELSNRLHKELARRAFEKASHKNNIPTGLPTPIKSTQGPRRPRTHSDTTVPRQSALIHSVSEVALSIRDRPSSDTTLRARNSSWSESLNKLDTTDCDIPTQESPEKFRTSIHLHKQETDVIDCDIPTQELPEAFRTSVKTVPKKSLKKAW